MPIPDAQILHLNPWWRDPSAIERNPKIRALDNQLFRWDPPVLDAVEMGIRRIHTLRGPRQVGKSTTAKRLIHRLLDHGERRVLYFSFELATAEDDIADVIHRARQLHPDPDLQLPLSFRDFSLSALGLALPESTLTPGEMLTAHGVRTLRELHLSMAEWRLPLPSRRGSKRTLSESRLRWGKLLRYVTRWIGYGAPPARVRWQIAAMQGG